MAYTIGITMSERCFDGVASIAKASSTSATVRDIVLNSSVDLDELKKRLETKHTTVILDDDALEKVRHVAETLNIRDKAGRLHEGRALRLIIEANVDKQDKNP